MAGGGAVSAGAGARASEYKFKFNIHIVLVTIVGASAGLLFGYDIGVTGGVTSNDAFLAKYFPHHVHKTSTDPYCQFDDIQVQMFTSSLFFAGMIAAIAAGFMAKKFGRRLVLIVASIFFLAGAALTGFAPNFIILVIGRCSLGVGVGLANQSAPTFLSEVAPAALRGALNIMFQLAVTVGILAAQIINLVVLQHDWYQLSLLLAGAPAIILLFGSLIMSDTPNSLAERGYLDDAKKVLQKIRGVPDIEAEYADIVDAVDQAAQYSKNPWVILKRRYRPQLTFAIMIPLFQQLTGINSIMFYAPVIFKSLGFGDSAALTQTVITGVINLVSTFVSIAVVDRAGRRILFTEGGIQMAIALFLSGGSLALGFSPSRAIVNEDGSLMIPKVEGIVYLICVCLFTAGFAWSWGPLGWLVPIEVQPLETRAVGASINVVTNFAMTFIIGQVFLTLMCALKWGIMVFFGGFVVIMTVWVWFFVPETKGVPIEKLDSLWRGHWFWNRFVGDYSTMHDMEMAAHDESVSLKKAAEGDDDDDYRKGEYHI